VCCHRWRPRYALDRSGHRAASPASRVVVLAPEAAPRPRARLTEVRTQHRHGAGSERSLAEIRRPSAADRVCVPRLADSCVFPYSKDCTKRVSSASRELWCSLAHQCVNPHANVGVRTISAARRHRGQRPGRARTQARMSVPDGRHREAVRRPAGVNLRARLEPHDQPRLCGLGDARVIATGDQATPSTRPGRPCRTTRPSRGATTPFVSW